MPKDLSPEKQAELNEQLFDAIINAEDNEFTNGKRNEVFNFPLTDDHLTKVEALLKAGADPDDISNFRFVNKYVRKRSYIENAAVCPDYKLYQLLLKHDASLFRDDETNRMVLFEAVMHSENEDKKKIATDILSRCNTSYNEVLYHVKEKIPTSIFMKDI